MSPSDRSTVTLRVTSPCEHGVHHEFLELPAGVSFATRKCVDSKGRPRNHEVTDAKYPKKVRRR